MRQPVQQRGSHLFVHEHRRPLGEAEVGCDDNASALVQFADQVEQQCTARLADRQVTQLIEYDQIGVDQAVGHPALLPGLLGTGLYMLAIAATVRLNPASGPAGERMAWPQRLRTMRSVWPVFLLFVLVIGGVCIRRLQVVYPAGLLIVSRAGCSGRQIPGPCRPSAGWPSQAV